MSNYDVLVVRRDQATADEQRDLIAETGYVMLAGLKLKDYFKSIVTGAHPAAVQTKVNLVFATGTITLSSLVATDTVTVAGATYTCVASGATGPLQFNVGADDTASAASIAALVNADTATGAATATSALGVVTVNAYLPGKIGNLVSLGISAHGSKSGALLTGGTNGDQERTHYYGSVGSTF